MTTAGEVNWAHGKWLMERGLFSKNAPIARSTLNSKLQIPSTREIPKAKLQNTRMTLKFHEPRL